MIPTTLEQLRADLEALIAYNWSDEERDYKEHPSRSHIFLRLKRLDAFLRKD